MTDSPTSLYTAWLDALPQAFRAMIPAASDAATPSAAPGTFQFGPLPFPAEQIGNALNTLDGILTQIYHAYLPLLAKGGLTAEAIKGVAGNSTEVFNRMLATMSGMSGTPAATTGMGQLQLGMERTFGGLADAFGLGPMRELSQAWRELLSAGVEKQRAQAEYLALVLQAWNKGTEGLLKELQAMGARGERVESLLAFTRLWAKAIDGPLHETMQDSRGLDVTAKVIRASSRQREQLQKTIGLASEALHVPTRNDMDEAFREIQELKRELRRFKRALPAAAQKKLAQSRESEA